MVNRKLQRPVAPMTLGISCGECGLPGLGVRMVPVQGIQGAKVPMLLCGFCQVGKPVGRIQQKA